MGSHFTIASIVCSVLLIFLFAPESIAWTLTLKEHQHFTPRTSSSLCSLRCSFNLPDSPKPPVDEIKASFGRFGAAVQKGVQRFAEQKKQESLAALSNYTSGLLRKSSTDFTKDIDRKETIEVEKFGDSTMLNVSAIPDSSSSLKELNDLLSFSVAENMVILLPASASCPLPPAPRLDDMLCK